MCTLAHAFKNIFKHIFKGEQYVVGKEESNQNCIEATRQWNEADFLFHYVLFSDACSLNFQKYKVNTKCLMLVLFKFKVLRKF